MGLFGNGKGGDRIDPGTGRPVRMSRNLRARVAESQVRMAASNRRTQRQISQHIQRRKAPWN